MKPAVIINAAGPITPLGAGLVRQEVLRAVDDILQRSVEIAELQQMAASAISSAFGAQAGCVVGCTAAGIAIGVAAAMTGNDLNAVERLPDTRGLKKNRVLLQRGHDCWFGATVGQMIRLAGAQIDYVTLPGQGTNEALRSAIHANTAAAVFVSSHHVQEEVRLSLADFVDVCRNGGVPVIVDAAGSVDITPYIRAGADLVAASAHKNFDAPTAGILAGRRDFVAACLLQERGIGRAMKVGKEGIAGVVAALEGWRPESGEHKTSAWRARCEAIIGRLGSMPAATTTLEWDPPEDRVPRVRICPEPTRASAKELVAHLRGAQPAIRVWEAGVQAGYFELDPRCLHDTDIDHLCARIRAAFSRI